MTNTFISMGIDPSSVATGIVVLEHTKPFLHALVLEEEVKFPKLTGWDRVIAICKVVMTRVHEHKPDRIVLEGYSLNMKNATSVVPLVELGGLMRFLMKLDGLSWYDPRATELKKFVTGKGNVQKDVVMMKVLQRWGHESKSNNTADAYGLAAMGLAHANRLSGVTLDMRAIVAKMAEKTN